MSTLQDNFPPLDTASQQRLREIGLDYRFVDSSSDADHDAFLRADARGFLDEDPSDTVIAEQRESARDRRNIGVYDAAAGAWPVATVNGWLTPLTVPGGEIDMWAISSGRPAIGPPRAGAAPRPPPRRLRATPPPPPARSRARPAPRPRRP